MSEPNWQTHPNNPKNQPFNITGKKSSKRGWWLRGNNNRRERSE
jgi:hypothetical protein